MYAGEIVEQARIADLFERPQHPYTQGLINSIPILGENKPRLEVIPGVVPSLIDLPEGCRFAPRCTLREKLNLSQCTETNPILESYYEGHLARCWAVKQKMTPLAN